MALASAALAPGQDSGPDARPERAAAQFLAGKYPSPRRDARGRARVTITPIFDPGAAICAVTARSLEARMPATRFFVTTTRSFSEFPVVPTVVAVERAADGTWRGTRSCLCPLFTAPEPDFLALFRGVATESDAERARVGDEIGLLFGEIWAGGTVRRGSYAFGQFTGELWIDQHLFRTVAVRFDPTGLIEDVRLIVPHQPPRPAGPAPAMPK